MAPYMQLGNNVKFEPKLLAAWNADSGCNAGESSGAIRLIRKVCK